jgi:hypothetical protein
MASVVYNSQIELKMPKRRIHTDFADFDFEASLRTAVAGLIQRMENLSEVRIVHGAQENGKDILFTIRGAFAEQQLCAAMVRNGKVTGRALPALHAQLAQIQDAPYVTLRQPMVHHQGADRQRARRGNESVPRAARELRHAGQHAPRRFPQALDLIGAPAQKHGEGRLGHATEVTNGDVLARNEEGLRREAG